jgi:DNA-binding PadR family transcriptional regulator
VSIRQLRSSRLSPEYVLLGYLFDSPDHGYNLHKRMIDEFGHIWHSSQSQTYNILKRLADKGYINGTLIEQGKLPSKQLLHISDSGNYRFESWLSTPTSCSVHAIRVEFITRLYFMRRYHSAQVKEMIESQAEVVRAGIAQLEKLDGGKAANDFDRLAVELRIKLLKAVLEWLTECFAVDAGKDRTG